MMPCTSQPLARSSSARYEPSWPVMPVINTFLAIVSWGQLREVPWRRQVWKRGDHHTKALLPEARRLVIVCWVRTRNLPMIRFSSLRARLVGTVFVAIAPAWVLMYHNKLPWSGFVVGLLALGAAWFGGERDILRQIRLLIQAAKRWPGGDLRR